MRVAGHCGESGKMFVVQCVRQRREHFTGREIVEVALRHGGGPFPSPCGEGPLHSIAFAVLRLITSSNFAGCSTGISAGLVPCSTFIISRARRRYISL